MVTKEPRYSPLDLLRGYWTWIDERRGITLIRLAATHRRARIAGVILIVALYWTLRDRLPGELLQWELLFVVATIWLLLGKWNKGPTILAVIENDEFATRETRNLIPRQTIAMSQIREIEVRENLWKGHNIIALCQVYLHRKDSPVPVLIYQHWRTRRQQVLQLATRLADRWEVRLRVDDA